MSEFPYMPLWVGKYISKTHHLTTIEHGAYLLLLMASWQSPTHDLPDDDKTLAKYAHLTLKQWCRIRPALESLSDFTIENERWISSRLTREVVAVRRLTKQRSNAGKSSALKRKEAGSTSVPTERQRETSTHTHTHTQKVSSKSRDSAPAKRGTRLPEDWVPSDENISFALQEGVTNDGTESIGHQFRDYWIAQPGQKGLKLDWDATWRNWVRRDYSGGAVRSNGVGSQKRPQIVGAVEASARYLARHAGDDDL